MAEISDALKIHLDPPLGSRRVVRLHALQIALSLALGRDNATVADVITAAREIEEYVNGGVYGR